MIDYHPLTVSLLTPLAEIVLLMNEYHPQCQGNDGSSCVLVLEKKRVQGIITETDLLPLMVQKSNFDCLLAKDVMVTEVITLPENQLTGVSVALSVLPQFPIRYLPIVDEYHQLLGVVTESSLLRSLSPVIMNNVMETLHSPQSHNLAEPISPLQNQFKVFSQFSSHSPGLRENKSVNILVIEAGEISINILRQRLALESEYQFNLIHQRSLSEAEDAIASYGRDYFNSNSQELTILEQFKQKFPAITTIILTEKYQEKIALDVIKKGGQDYLVKSVFFDEKNLNHDSFILPLLTAIERQKKQTTLNNKR